MLAFFIFLSLSLLSIFFSLSVRSLEITMTAPVVLLLPYYPFEKNGSKE